MLNLFALTNNPAKRIVKFDLSQPVQVDLTAHITAQEEKFDRYTEEIEFDGKYKPEEEEVLFIDNYDEIEGLENAISNPASVESVDPTEDFFSEIKAIFTGYNRNGSIKILLQNFDRRKIISTNGLSIFHSGNVYKKIEGIGLTIDTKICATLESGKLRFYSFHLARNIFDLSQYYKTATDEDLIEFIQCDVIQTVDSEAFLRNSDSWIRRKVSLIQQSGILQEVPLNDIKTIASEFNIPLATVIEGNSEVISLPTSKQELKKLLRFLDEDYYKSPLSKTNFISNSKRLAS